MTYDQLFAWCFQQHVTLRFLAENGKQQEVHVIRMDCLGTEERIGRGRNVAAAIQDAIMAVKKQEVSA